MNYVTLSTPSASCKIALHGAHVTSYIRDGKERFFVSEQAVIDGTKAIRGGVPICWPWFGQLHPEIKSHNIAHGLVRNQPWHIIAQTYRQNESSVTLSPTDCQHPLWPKGLSCKVKITLNDVLEIRLITSNESTELLTFSGALHSYFSVPDVTKVQLKGFGNSHQYIDNNTGLLHNFSNDNYELKGEIDRVHLLPVLTTLIACDTPVKIDHQGHDSLVVWNPGNLKAKALSDLADQEYRDFVCIETAITQGQALSPKSHHELTQRIR